MHTADGVRQRERLRAVVGDRAEAVGTRDPEGHAGTLVMFHVSAVPREAAELGAHVDVVRADSAGLLRGRARARARLRTAGASDLPFQIRDDEVAERLRLFALDRHGAL